MRGALATCPAYHHLQSAARVREVAPSSLLDILPSVLGLHLSKPAHVCGEPTRERVSSYMRAAARAGVENCSARVAHTFNSSRMDETSASNAAACLLSLTAFLPTLSKRFFNMDSS